jgi:predicted nucleotidyltransferase component of viral defense system
MLKYVLKIQSPLYAVSNSQRAVQTIQLDINLFERPLMHVKEAFRRPIYPDIAPYLLNSLEAEELLADKIKALVERIEPVARDLYDAWLLSTKYELKPDLELVGKKMQLYGRKSGEQFSLEVLKERIASIKGVWDSEIGRLLRDPPSYDEVAKGFLEKL